MTCSHRCDAGQPCDGDDASPAPAGAASPSPPARPLPPRGDVEPRPPRPGDHDEDEHPDPGDDDPLAPPDLDRRVLFGPVVARRASLLAAAMAVGAAGGGAAALAAGWGAPGGGLAAAGGAIAVAALFVGVHLGRIVPALRREDAETAFDDLNLLAAWSGAPDVWLPLRLAALCRFGYFEEAIELIRARRPHVHAGWLARQLDERLAVLLVLLERDLDEADALLRAGLARRPGDAGLSIALGFSLWQRDRHLEAADRMLPHAAAIATMAHARRASIYYALGESLARSGRGREAAEWFRHSTAWEEREREERIAEGVRRRAARAAAGGGAAGPGGGAV